MASGVSAHTSLRIPTQPCGESQKYRVSRNYLGASVIAAMFFCLFLPVIARSESATVEATEASKESKKETEKKTETQGLTIEGLYLGRIGYLDPKGRYLYLLPEIDGLRKKAIFIDKSTKFRKNRKPFSKKKLELGQKVAVRFFGEGSLLIADGVFIVEDEFKLLDYQIRR